MKGMIYGYARISTKKQNIERQIENIVREQPQAIVIKETYTGTTTDRPQWQKLLGRVKEGDTIVFDEVSRMSRNAEEGFKDYQELFNKGVNLVFIKEPHISTDVYRKTLESGIAMTGTEVDVILKGVNEYLMILAKKQIEIAFDKAQAEVDNMRIRTIEGLRVARQNGKQIGRREGAIVRTKKGEETIKAIRKYSKNFDGMMADSDIIKLLGVDRHTYYKYKAQLNATSEG